ncbi:plasmid IncI1-type surface exclusion protein ExcA [Pseudomonas syringae]|nr:plasmid IncI1-type surface exclusion protein ExcA [Pseudomonas syringae]
MGIQRLKTHREGWFGVFKMMYMMIAFPFALIVGIPSLFVAPSLIERGAYTTLTFCALLWVAVLVPVLLLLFRTRARKSMLRGLKESISDACIFKPDSAHEIYHEGDIKYFGIDINNGTVLYVNQVRKGQVDVIGMNVGDWTHREIDGSILRLYTKFPELPRIEISTPWAQRWFDTLGAMEHKHYVTPQRFSTYVTSRIDQLERDNNIHIPKLA